VSNIAFRVALGSAFAGAVACGFLGLLVSRGSSMLMEGIEELKTMTGKWEAAICVVSGFVAGGLLGFNGFMWSQSVIVEVYSLSVLSLVLVLLWLLRWMYAPNQKRYLSRTTNRCSWRRWALKWRSSSPGRPWGATSCSSTASSMRLA
jgi:hypothetical protein